MLTRFFGDRIVQLHNIQHLRIEIFNRNICGEQEKWMSVIVIDKDVHRAKSTEYKTWRCHQMKIIIIMTLFFHLIDLNDIELFWTYSQFTILLSSVLSVLDRFNDLEYFNCSREFNYCIYLQVKLGINIKTISCTTTKYIHDDDDTHSLYFLSFFFLHDFHVLAIASNPHSESESYRYIAHCCCIAYWNTVSNE